MEINGTSSLGAVGQGKEHKVRGLIFAFVRIREGGVVGRWCAELACALSKCVCVVEVVNKNVTCFMCGRHGLTV